MQIFVTDKCPKKSAERLQINKTRANKMITESQQILACCQKRILGYVSIKKADGSLYSTPISRMNHPVVKWASSGYPEMTWLVMHLDSLLNYYKGDGFKNVRQNIDIMMVDIMSSGEDSYFPKSFLNFAKADSKGLDFTAEPCVFTAYDKFLKAQGA